MSKYRVSTTQVSKNRSKYRWKNIGVKIYVSKYRCKKYRFLKYRCQKYRCQKYTCQKYTCQKYRCRKYRCQKYSCQKNVERNICGGGGGRGVKVSATCGSGCGVGCVCGRGGGSPKWIVARNIFCAPPIICSISCFFNMRGGPVDYYWYLVIT